MTRSIRILPTRKQPKILCTSDKAVCMRDNAFIEAKMVIFNMSEYFHNQAQNQRLY